MSEPPGPKETSMNRRIFVCALAFASALLAGTPVLADDRLEKATYHVEEALTNGLKLKDAGLLAYHADLALEKAEGVQKFKPNPHLAEAIVHIKAAVAEGRDNHLQPAIDHIKAASDELKQVPK